mmetsp:Transcript_24475/g.45248  ORF Transcript_24475/g.45248 Transcript_24475/m.45248 type:complete len:121 (+) Transcript_24475:835-1197(+)
MATAWALAAGFAFWTFKNRKERLVRASQPLFLLLICLGCFVMSSAILPFSIDDSIASQRGCDVACMAWPWLFSSGFAVAFSALCSKLWRINKVMNHARRLRKVVVTEKVVLVSLFSAAEW